MTYWHNQIVNTADYPEVQKSEIHVLDLETGDDIRIGYDTDLWQELLPKFSPDGAAVLFVRKKFIPFASGATLTIAAADGSDGPGRKIDSGPLHDFGTDTGGMENPVFEFSPDGRKIIVAMGPQRRLLVIDVATAAVEQGAYGEFPFLAANRALTAAKAVTAGHPRAVGPDRLAADADESPGSEPGRDRLAVGRYPRLTSVFRPSTHERIHAARRMAVRNGLIDHGMPRRQLRRGATPGRRNGRTSTAARRTSGTARRSGSLATVETVHGEPAR